MTKKILNFARVPIDELQQGKVKKFVGLLPGNTESCPSETNHECATFPGEFCHFDTNMRHYSTKHVMDVNFDVLSKFFKKIFSILDMA